MKVKDLIGYLATAIEKYEKETHCIEEVADLKITLSRMKLMSPEAQNKDLSIQKERQVRKYYKKLGIQI